MTDRDSYKHLYRSARWLRLRKIVLQESGGICSMCGCGLTTGRVSPRSAVVHHVRPHKGDLALFHDLDNLQAVCRHCHDTAGARSDNRGYSTEIGLDGWPVDPLHPANRSR